MYKEIYYYEEDQKEWMNKKKKIKIMTISKSMLCFFWKNKYITSFNDRKFAHGNYKFYEWNDKCLTSPLNIPFPFYYTLP